MVIVMVALAELGFSVSLTLLAISLVGTLLSATEVPVSEVPTTSKPAAIKTRTQVTSIPFIVL